VSLSVIDLLVGLTGGAKARFELLDEPKDQPFLFFACAIAERTFEALFGFGAILLGNFFGFHNLLLSKRNPVVNFMPNIAALLLCEDPKLVLRHQLDAVADSQITGILFVLRIVPVLVDAEAFQGGAVIFRIVSRP